MYEEDISYRFGAGRYLQKPDVLKDSGSEILRYGKKVYVIGGYRAFEAAWSYMEESFRIAGLSYVKESYSGYPSVQKIAELKVNVQRTGCDVLAAVGGGRVIDLAKAAAFELKLPIAAIPTQAATCAAYSPISVLYTPEGKSDAYIQSDYEVNTVLADETVMMSQPPRLLSAGILDAMAKFYEISALHPEKLDEHVSIARYSAYHAAEFTCKVLKEKGRKAVSDLEKGQLTKDIHDVIFTNIALTGMISALMQGRGQTSLAHAFNNALHMDFLKQADSVLHGEGVALGLIAQFVYNDSACDTDKLKFFMKELHMPCTLDEIGIKAGRANQEILYNRLKKYPFMMKDSCHERLLWNALSAVTDRKESRV